MTVCTISLLNKQQFEPVFLPSSFNSCKVIMMHKFPGYKYSGMYNLQIKYHKFAKEKKKTCVFWDPKSTGNVVRFFFLKEALFWLFIKVKIRRRKKPLNCLHGNSPHTHIHIIISMLVSNRKIMFNILLRLQHRWCKEVQYV